MPLLPATLTVADGRAARRAAGGAHRAPLLQVSRMEEGVCCVSRVEERKVGGGKLGGLWCVN